MQTKAETEPEIKPAEPGDLCPAMHSQPLKILILGGYGTFGGRLCQLLASEENLVLLVAGRSLGKARAFCASLPPGGAARQPLVFDRSGDIAAQLQNVQVDLLIDASGPFQTYQAGGADPYQVVKACIASSIHYMDLADGSDFVQGIAAFDPVAKAQGVFVLSGVSSFPVLTAAAVRRLAQGLGKVTSIRGGVAPSPFAVVGENVIRAIAAYAGQKTKLTRNGLPAYGYPLTETCRYTVAPPGRLPLANIRFSLVDVPDLQAMPALWPGLQNIWMGAGTVPEISHRLLNVLAWLVRLGLLPSLLPLTPLFLFTINRLRWGDHRGGMFVEVSGSLPDGRKTVRSWHLLAEGDDGPFIPCMALQALVLRMAYRNKEQKPAPGARAASNDLELADYEALFVQRTLHSGQWQSTEGDVPVGLFKTLLGSAWYGLPPSVQRLHNGYGPQRWVGQARVERGTHWLARLVAFAIGFPTATKGLDTVPVQVQIQPEAAGERWTRFFGERAFHSFLAAGTGRSDRLLTERFGPFTMGLALVLENGKLSFKTRNWQLWGLALPAWLGPSGNSYELSDARDCFGFHIEIMLPWVGLVVKYAGWLALSSSVDNPCAALQ